MSEQDNFSQILAAFGHTIGLEDLAVDADGYAALAIDDRLIVNLERVPNGERVLLYSAVGKPAGDLLESYAMLLEANFLGRGTFGATLGLSPDSDMIVLSQFVPLAALDLSGFTSALEVFVNAAEQWTARMAHLGVPAMDDTSVQAGQGSQADMLRV
jgi:hypothetical protein